MYQYSFMKMNDISIMTIEHDNTTSLATATGKGK